MSHLIEKLEACPKCGEIKRWLYDAQICAKCGHGDRYREQKERNPQIGVSAVWLKRIGDFVIVEVEVDGRWVPIIREHSDGAYSHICEANGIRDRLSRLGIMERKG